MVRAALDDWRSAPLQEKTRAMLGLLEKVTRTPALVMAAHVEPLLAIGISRQALEDALLICACFNIIARVADALDVAIPSAQGFAFTAEHLLEQGYI